MSMLDPSTPTPDANQSAAGEPAPAPDVAGGDVAATPAVDSYPPPASPPADNSTAATAQADTPSPLEAAGSGDLAAIAGGDPAATPPDATTAPADSNAPSSAGAPDTLSTPAPRLGLGDVGQDVADLARDLARLGHDLAAAAGARPIFDDNVAAAVAAVQEAAGLPITGTADSDTRAAIAATPTPEETNP